MEPEVNSDHGAPPGSEVPDATLQAKRKSMRHRRRLKRAERASVGGRVDTKEVQNLLEFQEQRDTTFEELGLCWIDFPDVLHLLCEGYLFTDDAMESNLENQHTPSELTTLIEALAKNIHVMVDNRQCGHAEVQALLNGEKEPNPDNERMRPWRSEGRLWGLGFLTTPSIEKHEPLFVGNMVIMGVWLRPLLEKVFPHGPENQPADVPNIWDLVQEELSGREDIFRELEEVLRNGRGLGQREDHVQEQQQDHVQEQQQDQDQEQQQCQGQSQRQDQGQRQQQEQDQCQQQDQGRRQQQDQGQCQQQDQGQRRQQDRGQRQLQDQDRKQREMKLLEMLRRVLGEEEAQQEPVAPVAPAKEPFPWQTQQPEPPPVFGMGGNARSWMDPGDY